MQWKSHLKWAMAHCDGLLRVVVLKAVDTQAKPKVLESCYPDANLILKIIRFDAKTGCFRARYPDANEGLAATNSSRR